MDKKELCRWLATEPYRVFFPAAILAGVVGVLLWPAFYAGQLSYYPSFAHARLMIEGFVGGFAVGFLGTALPKMLSVAALRVWQVALLLSLHLAFCVAHLLGEIRLGDGLFAAMMLILIGCMAWRVVKRQKLPPPGMLMAGMGLLCGTFGAVWGAFFAFDGSIYVTSFAYRLLYQAFILLPLLGVGTFIFPMILGTPNKSAMLAGRKWRGKALEAGLIGVLIIASYWIEVRGQQRAMSWVRFALAAVWLVKECGVLKIKSGRGIMTHSLRAGIGCLLLALVAVAVVQQQKIALDHILYVGGFGLITMIVATRVIFGHSGQGKQFNSWNKALVVCVGLLLLGMATRVSADFLPNVRNSHHVYAAVCWVAVSIIWAVAILPSVRKRPPSSGPNKPFPTAKKTNLLTRDFR